MHKYQQDNITELTRQIMRENRVLANSHMTMGDRLLFVAFERLYPALQDGIWLKISELEIASKFGVGRSTVSRYVSAMRESGVYWYDLKKSKALITDMHGVQLAQSWQSEVWIAETDLAILSPEDIRSKVTEKRERHRKQVKHRLECPVCGSHDILFVITPTCRSCSWRLPLEIEEV